MTSMRRLSTLDADFSHSLDQLLRRDTVDPDSEKIHQWVKETIERVRVGGDSALKELTLEFDGCNVDELGVEIPSDQIQAATEHVPKAQLQALEYAAERIRHYHRHQLEQSWRYTEADGTTLGQKITPLQRVGLYVPGGKAAYPSSVLMNAIPAKVAGVNELIVTTPTPNGETNPMVLAAAAIAGVDRIFRIGGAQAIAALAYGTETIPKVDKITGPGNAWVATAKQQVFGQVGIDMIAGPSEVLVIADSSAEVDWVAMDLFAQAEHDEMAQAILLTQDAEFADAVEQAIQRLLPSMDRREIITTSLNNNGAIIMAHNDSEVIEIADHIAAEHLEIFTENAASLTEKISNAGAIFVGKYSAESLGDYCAGPNHVLPTSGTARFSSPLGVYDFQKRTSVLTLSAEGAATMATHAAELARGESLAAHALSAQLRGPRRQTTGS